MRVLRSITSYLYDFGGGFRLKALGRPVASWFLAASKTLAFRKRSLDLGDAD